MNMFVNNDIHYICDKIIGFTTMKRFFDISISLSALLLLSPILSIFCFAVWMQDFSNPFYIATRTGLNGSKNDKVTFNDCQC